MHLFGFNEIATRPYRTAFLTGAMFPQGLF
jgi:hypothetical protein